jgi:hypothetical protein
LTSSIVIHGVRSSRRVTSNMANQSELETNDFSKYVPSLALLLLLDLENVISMSPKDSRFVVSTYDRIVSWEDGFFLSMSIRNS